MVVSSTMFRHKNIHKITWRSPDGITCNQIDHILFGSRHKSDILDNEHFDNLLNSENGDYEALTGSTKTQSQIVAEPPSLEEVIEAKNKLKDDKAPSPAIPSELLKNEGKETSKKVYDLIQAI
ncbi:hypothetical protein TNCV_4798031 [Trichonephila clavipes]|nr:hypothetical protein TNCV_4798031 [Trichonephila clavipes]